MSTIILNALEFAIKLKAGGFTEQQTETQARASAEIVEKQLATKQDIETYETDLKRDIQESENRLKIKIKDLEISLKKGYRTTTNRNQRQQCRNQGRVDSLGGGCPGVAIDNHHGTADPVGGQSLVVRVRCSKRIQVGSIDQS